MYDESSQSNPDSETPEIGVDERGRGVVPTEAMLEIMSSIEQLAAVVERLRVENAELKLEVRRLFESIEPQQRTRQPSADSIASDIPRFKSFISAYEVGELFQNEAAYDLKLEFADAESLLWYRVWKFADAGQTLHVIVESCVRTKLPHLAAKFTFCRDVNALTVYAKSREDLEELLHTFQAANATYDGALKLLDNISDDVRYE